MQKHYERVNGFRFPEAELRQQRESTPGGGVGKERDSPGNHVLMTMVMIGSKKYSNNRYLRLSFLRTRTVWEPGLTTMQILQCGPLARPIRQRWQLLQRGRRQHLKMLCLWHT